VPKLTKRFVDALKPVTRDTLYRDSELKGFALRVKPPGPKAPPGAHGARTWIVQYRNKAGRTRKLMLAKVGELTPDEARDLAADRLGEVRKGQDPSANRHASRKDLTVAEAVEIYLKEGPADKPRKKASSWDIDASNLRRHAVPLLGRRLVKSLTRTDIQKLQRDVTTGKTKATGKGVRKRGRLRVTGGAGTAWRATVVVAAMLSWLVKRGLLEENPAEGVELNKLPKRERFLTSAELARLGDAMQEADKEGVNPVGLNIIRVLLLSGARKTEIASAKGAYLDVEHSALRQPDSKTDEKVIPLGAAALAILTNLAPEDPEAWIFPASRGDGHFKGVSRIWKGVATKAGLKVGRDAGRLGVRVHDLRHTYASVTAAGGDSLFILGKILGHRKTSTTEKYAHLHLDPIRAVADRTASKIAGALKGNKTTNVVKMAGRRRLAPS
jgi:integrase